MGTFRDTFRVILTVTKVRVKGGRTMNASEELTRLLDERPDLIDFVLQLVLDEQLPIGDHQ